MGVTSIVHKCLSQLHAEVCQHSLDWKHQKDTSFLWACSLVGVAHLKHSSILRSIALIFISMDLCVIRVHHLLQSSCINIIKLLYVYRVLLSLFLFSEIYLKKNTSSLPAVNSFLWRVSKTSFPIQKCPTKSFTLFQRDWICFETCIYRVSDSILCQFLTNPFVF